MSLFDCELIRAGLVAQPVNTVSSLAFMVAASFLYRRHRLGAVALGLVGVGSMLFHGWPSTIASITHDGAIVLLIGVLATSLWEQRTRLPWHGIAISAAGIGIWMVSRTGGPWCDPTSLLQGHGLWHVLAASGSVAILARHNRPASVVDELDRLAAGH